MISTECPQAGCARKLKVPPEMAGRVLVCPGCGTRFQLPPRVQAIPLPTATATGSAPVPLVPAPGTHPAPLPLPTAPRKATPLPPPPRRDRDEEIDDPSPKLKTKRPRRDDDDDIDDPPPKPKGKRSRRDRDEDIDDPPPKQSRRSRRGDDEDDDRKPKGKKTGGGRGLLIGGGVAVVLAVSLTIGGCVLFGKKDEAKVFGKYGGIEIGASGVKAIAADFVENKEDGYGYTFVFDPESKDVSLGTLADGDTAFDERAITDAVAAVKAHHTTLVDKGGVAKDRIHIAASSGLFSKFKTPEAAERAKGVLGERVKAAVGAEVGFVTADEEGRYGALNCIPPEKRKNGLLIDVGSGNIKGGCFDTDGSFIPLSWKQGTKSYTKEVEDNDKLVAGRKTRDRLREDLLTKPLRDEVSRKAVLGARKEVCLIGGVVWAMANYTNPQEFDKTRPVIPAADFDRFRDQVVKLDQDKVRADAADKLSTSPAKRTQVEEEFGKIKKAFTPAQLRGGAEVLRAVADAYEFDKKNVHFYRHSLHAWLLGYVADKSGIEKAATAPRK